MDGADDEVREIASLLADDCAQTILIETANEPMSADELSEVCDVSPQTIYRRLDDLPRRPSRREALLRDKIDVPVSHYPRKGPDGPVRCASTVR